MTVALRRPAADPAEHLVLVRDVLAELNQVDPGRGLDEEAEGFTRTLPARLVSRDWAGRPQVPALDAERMLLAMRRDRNQVEAERQERLAEAERSQVLAMPPGTIGFTRPGEPDWVAPGHDPRILRGPLVTDMPG